MSRTRGGRKRSAPPSSGRMLAPQLLVARREPHLVAGEPHPGAVEGKLARARQPLQHGAKGGRRQPRLELQPQPFQPDARQIGILRMKRLQRRDEAAPEPRPARRGEGERSAGHGDRNEAETPGNRLQVGGGHRPVAREGRQVDIVGRSVQKRRQRLRLVGDSVGGKRRQALRRAALARRRTQIEEAPAADGALGRSVAQHEAVAGGGRDRFFQHELHERLAARRHRLVAEQHDAGADIRGGVVEPHRRPLRERLSLGGEQAERCVDAKRRRMQVRVEHDVAARDRVLGDAFAGKIDGAALACLAALDRAVLGVDRADARGEAGRADGEPVADRDRAGEHRAGHHRPRAGQREGAVDRQPEAAGGGAGALPGGGVKQVVPQSVDALSGHCRHRDDVGGRGVSAPASRRFRPRLACALRASARSAFVRATMPRSTPSRSIMARCSIVCGMIPSSAATTNSTKVDAGRPGQHVADEALVARHVDETEHRPVRRRQVGEAEIDGDAALLLLLPAVGIDAGQRAHQRRLAVIDVTGGADDHSSGSGSGSAAARSAAASLGGRQRAPRRLEEALGERAPALAGAQQPDIGGDRVAGDARAEMIGRAEHRLAVGVAPRGAALPPGGCHVRVAFDAKRVVVDHPEPRHRLAHAAFRRRERPAMRLRVVGRDEVALDQHPAQHVLRRPVARLRRLPVELGGAGIILLDALALEIERGEVAPGDRVAASAASDIQRAAKAGSRSTPKPSAKQAPTLPCARGTPAWASGPQRASAVA